MSGQSSTSIANRALQMLGAAAITALTDNSREARAANLCYDSLRRAELRGARWNFARKRAILAPSADAPTFGYAYAFPLPADFSYLHLPNDVCVDWQLEGRAILTNSLLSPFGGDGVATGPSLSLVYYADIQDATLFDPLFCDALSARMAMAMCEQITQSNQKLQMVEGIYKQALDDAKSSNAQEKLPVDAPEDSWIVAHGS